jgi:PPK2 family polyphosphate:nucleotide phosphotransferase
MPGKEAIPHCPRATWHDRVILPVPHARADRTLMDENGRMTDAGLPVSDLLRLPPGAVDLSTIDPRSTPGFDGGKAQGRKALRDLEDPLDDLQTRLYAEAHGDRGVKRSVLLVIQGMDTAGKGGIMRHCVGMLDPQGVQIAAFKAPTKTERDHDFLWRIEKRVPKPGMVGIFDRSHYEDVLIARVRKLVPSKEIERRYDAINEFELGLVGQGIRVITCMLHISNEEQRSRLMARLDNPAKYWKFNPGDIDERSLWKDYMAAYETALERCNTEASPFYVIPADRKWYARWAVTSILFEHLRAMDPRYPPATFDVDEQKARLAAT